MSAMRAICQRCGWQLDVMQPVEGAGELDLDQVKGTFRFCPRCRRYVGRACCWTPDLVTCLDCAPLEAEATADNLEPAQWALEEFRTSTRGLESVGIALDPAAEVDRSAAWEEAWWGVAWLVTRADSSRDAVSRRLWNAPGGTDGALQMVTELARVLAAYQRAQRETLERLQRRRRTDRVAQTHL